MPTDRGAPEGRHLTLTVLGGSSPFTIGLIDALVEVGDRLPMYDLRLQGRDEAALQWIRAYSEPRLEPLGWSVTSTSDRGLALEGADIVLHQARYGGLRGRLEAEELAQRHSVVADETLGPSALLIALRSALSIAQLADEIRSRCPDSWILNLVNPLGLTISLFEQCRVSRCIGLCELPLSTVQAIASTLHVAPERLTWSYSGLNHRGFVHGLSVNREEAVPLLVEALGDEAFNGILPEEILELNAVPVKQFALITRPGGTTPRAANVARIRSRILRELSHSPTQPPPSLGLRRLDWYSAAVVPALASLVTAEQQRTVVNVSLGEDVVREREVWLNARGVTPREVPTPPAGVQRWIDSFAANETKAVAAVLDPSYDRIVEALASDPVVPASAVADLAADVWRRYTRSTRSQGRARRSSATWHPIALDPRHVRVVLQAGGRGERLRPLTDSTPKPLCPVCGVPMLERLLRQLVNAGYRSFTVVTGWLAESVKSFVNGLDDLPPDVEIEFFREDRPLGNLGALTKMPKRAEPILLVFGDLITDLDFLELLRVHRASGADITLASHEETHRLRLGEIVADGERVRRYVEKPVKSFLICSGIALMEAPALGVLPFGESAGLTDLVNRALANRFRVIHWRHERLWFDVNSLEELDGAEATLRQNAGDRPQALSAPAAPAETGRVEAM
jgi:6-phospho-beta-glucosidase